MASRTLPYLACSVLTHYVGGNMVMMSGHGHHDVKRLSAGACRHGSLRGQFEMVPGYYISSPNEPPTEVTP